MRRSLIAELVVTILFVCILTCFVQSANAYNISGEKWSRGNGDKFDEYEFKPDNTLIHKSFRVYAPSDISILNGTWSQSGNTIEFILNNFLHCVGSMTDADNISFSCKDALSRNWSINLISERQREKYRQANEAAQKKNGSKFWYFILGLIGVGGILGFLGGNSEKRA